AHRSAEGFSGARHRHFRRRLLCGLVRARIGLGARGAFVAAPQTPPLALLIGLVAPLTLFLVGYRTIPALREFVLAADLRLIVGIQAWRWAGFGFLALYTYGVLPGIFAWPAGLGDMAIGATAPLVLSGLLRRPGY